MDSIERIDVERVKVREAESSLAESKARLLALQEQGKPTFAIVKRINALAQSIENSKIRIQALAREALQEYSLELAERAQEENELHKRLTRELLEMHEDAKELKGMIEAHSVKAKSAEWHAAQLGVDAKLYSNPTSKLSREWLAQLLSEPLEPPLTIPPAPPVTEFKEYHLPTEQQTIPGSPVNVRPGEPASWHQAEPSWRGIEPHESPVLESTASTANSPNSTSSPNNSKVQLSVTRPKSQKRQKVLDSSLKRICE